MSHRDVNHSHHTIYTNDFIKNLQDQVSRKIAKTVNKENQNRKYDLGEEINEEGIIKLTYYNNLLERLLKCDSCFKGYDPEDIVNIVKKNLNRL